MEPNQTKQECVRAIKHHSRIYATRLTFAVAVVLSELKSSLTGASERADRVCTHVIAAAIV